MDAVKKQTKQLNVLFLTDAGQIPRPLAKFLDSSSVPFSVLPADQFRQIQEHLGIIGTIVIDPTALDANQQNDLLGVLKALDAMLKTAGQTGDKDKTALADSLAEQLRMAGRVQRDFLPSHLPNTDDVHWATIFHPAEWVSGDIYDIARLDERRVGFYVADAVGHSMPAALLTMFLKQALVMRQTSGNDYRIFEPVDVITNLNLRMAQQKLSGCQFATCCYCLLNLPTLELCYARAGHPYPVLLRPGQPPRQLESRGSLLGVFPQAEYTQHKVQLQHGDKLLLYSDGAEGFIGRTDDTGVFTFNNEFCETAHLPIQQMFDNIETLLNNQEPPAPQPDDITLIGLELL